MNSNSEVIVYNSRKEMVEAIVKAEFEGICVDRPTDPLFRKILAAGAFTIWRMFGFIDHQLVKDVTLERADAQSIYWAFRNLGFLKAFDALAVSEHSWGWSFHDLDLLEGLITLVQSKLREMPEDQTDPNAWGALNIFKAFVVKMESINIMIGNIPCKCGHCVLRHPGTYFKNRKEIAKTRKEIERILIGISEEDIANSYNPA